MGVDAVNSSAGNALTTSFSASYRSASSAMSSNAPSSRRIAANRFCTDAGTWTSPPTRAPIRSRRHLIRFACVVGRRQGPSSQEARTTTTGAALPPPTDDVWSGSTRPARVRSSRCPAPEAAARCWIAERTPSRVDCRARPHPVQQMTRGRRKRRADLDVGIALSMSRRTRRFDRASRLATAANPFSETALALMSIDFSAGWATAPSRIVATASPCVCDRQAPGQRRVLPPTMACWASPTIENDSRPGSDWNILTISSPTCLLFLLWLTSFGNRTLPSNDKCRSEVTCRESWSAPAPATTT